MITPERGREAVLGGKEWQIGHVVGGTGIEGAGTGQELQRPRQRPRPRAKDDRGTKETVATETYTLTEATGRKQREQRPD